MDESRRSHRPRSAGRQAAQGLLATGLIVGVGVIALRGDRPAEDTPSMLVSVSAPAADVIAEQEVGGVRVALDRMLSEVATAQPATRPTVIDAAHRTVPASDDRARSTYSKSTSAGGNEHTLFVSLDAGDAAGPCVSTPSVVECSSVQTPEGILTDVIEVGTQVEELRPHRMFGPVDRALEAADLPDLRVQRTVALYPPSGGKVIAIETAYAPKSLRLPSALQVPADEMAKAVASPEVLALLQE